MKKIKTIILFSLLASMIGLPLQAEETQSAAAAKYDTKLPVEISSDNLEVLQRENKAIFKGNVIAVQGKLRLNADTMTVHYRQKDSKIPDEGKPIVPAVPQDEMGAISHIEVEGHVLVATPEESAQGDKGNYDVDKRVLRLTGNNVVLTREKNILRGKAVEYNLDTGHSILTNNTDPKKSKGDNRVRGVFVPKTQKK
jgi:lipopolysaccharide export system protein LptA